MNVRVFKKLVNSLRKITYSLTMNLRPFVLLFSLTLVGCESLQPSDPDLMQRHFELSSLLDRYQLPDKSRPPARNTDAEINALASALQRKSAANQWIFDGSMANRGVVVIGRSSSSGAAQPETVALYVYRASDGRLAYTHQTHSNGLDVGSCNQLARQVITR